MVVLEGRCCGVYKKQLAFSRFLGYDRGTNGELLIIEEQAKIVRKIYGYFLQGRSPYQIAKILTEQNIPTPSDKGKWCGATMKSILSNEKYKGDALPPKKHNRGFSYQEDKAQRGRDPAVICRGKSRGNHSADNFRQGSASYAGARRRQKPKQQRECAVRQD